MWHVHSRVSSLPVCSERRRRAPSQPARRGSRCRRRSSSSCMRCRNMWRMKSAKRCITPEETRQPKPITCSVTKHSTGSPTSTSAPAHPNVIQPQRCLDSRASLAWLKKSLKSEVFWNTLIPVAQLAFSSGIRSFMASLTFGLSSAGNFSPTSAACAPAEAAATPSAAAAAAAPRS